jgi:hypothetical protein
MSMPLPYSSESTASLRKRVREAAEIGHAVNPLRKDILSQPNEKSPLSGEYGANPGIGDSIMGTRRQRER